MQYGHVYVYSWDNEDYSTIGECGALDAISCLFEEVGNGMSEITLDHPLDALGKYRYLQRDAVLKAWVPVRTTPEIENGAYVVQMERWTIAETTTKQQRYVYNKQEGGRRVKTLAVGAEVVVTKKPANSQRWKIKSGKTSGWIAADGLENSKEIILPPDSAGIESAAPAWESREQLFRIYKVVKSDDGITVNARHISYDLLYNMTTFDTDIAVTLQETGEGVLGNCIDPHDFTFQTDIQGSQTGAHYVDVDPITAFLNPETGAAAAWNAQLVRDNFELSMLGNAGIDRGMRIEYARNLQGVTMDEDMDSVATCIRPVGENKDGSPLYLEGEGVLVSPYADQYPFERIYKLNCTDCKVGTNNVTVDIARKRMEAQALAMFENGADQSVISVRVVFAQLGNTEKYRQYRNLEGVFLFDSVRVVHPRLGIGVSSSVVRIVWNCLRQKMNTVELGSLQALTPSVASWSIPSGVNGSKIASGTIGSAQLGGDVISSRHIQAESINTEALQAEVVTAEKLAAGSVTAEKVKAGSLDTVVLEAVTAEIKKLDADKITADTLTGALAQFNVLTAGTAEFDRATVEHLVSKLFNLTGEAVMEDVFIHNLKVAYAQMVGATIGNLILQAQDGLYYEINVNQDGTVSATLANPQPTEGEIEEGVYGETKPIVATSMTVDDMNATNIKAIHMLVNRIDAASIDTDELFAREAFIDLLRTSRIVGEKSIEMIVGDVEEVQTLVRVDDDGLHVGDGTNTGEVLIDESSVNVVMNGQKYSQFASNYVQFGNYQLRQSADGGLVFKLKEG